MSDKKWYNLFVSVEPEGPSGEGQRGADAPTGRPPKPTRSAAQTVAEIASAVAPPKFTAPVKNPTSFDEIYAAAEIAAPPHGYTILKVADMLQSEHIRNLPPEVKRSSILVALEAAGVKLGDIIQDAVRRDRALDTYERVQQQALEKLEASKTEENRQIQSEMDRLVAEYRARIKANADQVAKEKERLESWHLLKQQAEQRIADAVAPFVSDNPVTVRGAAGPPPSSAAKPA